MRWVKAEYEVGSFFSYRIPDYPSPSYALSSPLPGPSTIKLAIVSTAIQTTGDINYGEKIFKAVRDAKIKIKVPKKIAVYNPFIKRLKKKKGGAHFEPTFGIRGYIHFLETLCIYLEVEIKVEEEIQELLKKIRRLGTSDSLVWCKWVTNEAPTNSCIEAVETLEEAQRNVLLVPVRDLNPLTEFDTINPYTCPKRKEKDIFVKKFFLLPISKKISGKNWIIYETR
ncbi:MAG: type I-A CRISPR-associated protein Cas5 [Candidatus Thermoplasmatota archaeon]